MKHINIPWMIRTIVITIVLSTIFTLLSVTALSEAGYLVAVLLLFGLMIFGIVFDMVGVAVTAARPEPFHAMAARREKAAKQAISLVKQADRVASFCNDVVGDIAGIVSGAGAAAIAARLVADFGIAALPVSLIISGFVVGFTIGGKIIGKSLAIHNSTEIVMMAARVICRIPWKFGSKT